MPVSRTVSGNPQITNLHDASSRAVRALELNSLYRLGKRVSALRSSGSFAKFDELCMVDTTDAAISVNLPKITPEYIGRSIVMVNRSSSINPVTVYPSSATINGSASYQASGSYFRRTFVALSTSLWSATADDAFTVSYNVPILSYSSTSTVNVAAAPGSSSTLSLTLSDGLQYQASTPVAVSLAVSGLGGIDTGSESASTWYYIYAVPAATSGTFSAVASITGPATGPTGYSAWKYLGAIRNDASSNIREFDQVGDEFFFRMDLNDGETLLVLSTGAATAAWTPITITTQIPTTVAGMARLRLFIDSDAGNVARVHIEPGNPPPYSPNGTVSSAGLAAGSAQLDAQQASEMSVYLFDGTLSYWTASLGTPSNIDLSIWASGYRDKYLSSSYALGIAYSAISLILTSPGGTRYRLGVTDAGALTTTVV